MPEEQITDQDPVLSWEYSEADRFDRGPAWYFSMVVAGLGLLLYALASGNFLFALIIIMFGLVIYLSSIHGAEEVAVRITEDGIQVGGASYGYSEIRHFWFVYEPQEDVKNLYLDFKEPWKPRVVLGLADQNPNMVREFLSAFIVEDLTKEEEPLLDAIGRMLKL